MICSFQRLLYPKCTPAQYDGSYAVALFRPHERVLDARGSPQSQVKVVGQCLPLADGLQFQLHGHWSKDPKYGPQFELESYENLIAPGREGIVAYLASGLLKGIGRKTADRIYDRFGDDTLDVLDNDPEALLKIPGISPAKLSRIVDGYLLSRGAREVVSLLAPHGVGANRAVKIFRQFGSRAAEIVKNHPYQLCEMSGIGFLTADAIAKSMGLAPLSGERIRAGLLQVLKDAETKGHLCLEKQKHRSLCAELLDTPGLTDLAVMEEADELLRDGALAAYRDHVYRAVTAQAEQGIARRVQELLDASTAKLKLDVNAEIWQEESNQGFGLAPEQRQAVQTCLRSPLSIITGGPGTGKTLVQRFLLNIYRREHPNAKIVCCAPTGRAARRMEQTTGQPASTIHKALGLLAGEDGTFNEPKPLQADLVLVDEVSMLDVFLARHLLNAVPDGCQLVLVGDADQLPSVGPGAVLSELIACGRVPVVKLDKVYRQNAGSLVATNAALIRHGDTALEYGADFKIADSDDLEVSAHLMERHYLQEVQRCGVDNVALLTPFRQKTATGANALNERLRELINPAGPGRPELASGKRCFRLGDKVMQVKNKGDVSNGDVGYVRQVIKSEDEASLTVDFGDGRAAEYDSSELELLELAYASTVHKSQGSEYQTVIINLQNVHYIMLKRPLVYTAITRAKQRVILVGERKALAMAIRTTDTERRGTMLAARINEKENAT
ncbi:MAG: ATP-dependent RecD-like DNA helicase [Firmicutes bacterium]|nr:ATP-dependent RecD-like DNA helicase [Bacillota bacterium]